jgi:hypothetical protein
MQPSEVSCLCYVVTLFHVKELCVDDLLQCLGSGRYCGQLKITRDLKEVVHYETVLLC